MTVYNTPFGYIKDESGKIVVDDRRAYYVEQIFKKFLQGEQKTKICAWLKEEQVERARGDCNWTHNSITSILNNKKYGGDETFPPIVSQELVKEVDEITVSRKNRSYCSTYSLYPLSYKIFCGYCGSVMHHKGYKRREGTIGAWGCSKTHETSSPKCNELRIDDPVIMQHTIEVCNYVISNWPKFKLNKHNQFKPIKSVKVMQLDLQLKDELNKSSINKDKVQELLKERTAEAWKCAKVNDFSLKNKLMEELIGEQGTLLQELDEKFFRKIIKKITLLPGGRVSFMLFNGIILSKEYSTKKYEGTEIIWKEQ